MKVRIAPLAAAGLLTLVGANAWFLAIVIEDLARGDQTVVGKVEWTPKLSTSIEGTPQARPPGLYAQTLAHPVFFKTREPYVAPPKPPAPAPVGMPAAGDPGLTVGGIMISHDLRKAYLLSRTEPRGTWVSEGDNFMGWKVQSVDAATIKLQQQDRTIELQLYAQK